MLESQFQKQVMKYLRDNGCYVLNVPGGTQIPSGTPDLIVCCPNGLFMGLELKVKGNYPSELQLYHIDCINKSGGYARVLYDYEFDEFKEWFENTLRSAPETLYNRR